MVLKAFSSFRWSLENSYLSLPEIFYFRQTPIPVSKPRLVLFNDKLALTLGLLDSINNSVHQVQEISPDIFSGNKLPPGAEPIAQAYAGHQFGHFTILGDGRAILLGEQLTPDQKRFDVQLKGSGRTPFARSGDGRAALGPMLREYIISEAMHALGIPTTRSLAVTITGDLVMRDSPLKGGVLTRVAASHIRVGTFEFAANRGGVEAVRKLSDYCIKRHYPLALQSENPYYHFLISVIDKQAYLITQWMLVGFIHGVMNSDNMSISGETIDYGPCAFMDTYDPATVFSFIDKRGRYAYGNQPSIGQWNLARFAETLLPLLSSDPAESEKLAEQAVSEFSSRFEKYFLEGMRKKIGLITPDDGDAQLITEFLKLLYEHKADFTNAFRLLVFTKSDEMQHLKPEKIYGIYLGRFSNGFEENFLQWKSHWLHRISNQNSTFEKIHQTMKSANPHIIARNHLVESALQLAEQKEDFSEITQLLKVLTNPFEQSPGDEKYSITPKSTDQIYRTYCGT